jgi:hypothetical protein
MTTSDQPPRKAIDCRRFPSEKNCTLMISGTEDEVLDLAVMHATTAHAHEETPDLREKLRSMLTDEETGAGAAA